MNVANHVCGKSDDEPSSPLFKCPFPAKKRISLSLADSARKNKCASLLQAIGTIVDLHQAERICHTNLVYWHAREVNMDELRPAKRARIACIPCRYVRVGMCFRVIDERLMIAAKAEKVQVPGGATFLFLLCETEADLFLQHRAGDEGRSFVQQSESRSGKPMS